MNIQLSRALLGRLFFLLFLLDFVAAWRFAGLLVLLLLRLSVSFVGLHSPVHDAHLDIAAALAVFVLDNLAA